MSSLSESTACQSIFALVMSSLVGLPAAWSRLHTRFPPLCAQIDWHGQCINTHGHCNRRVRMVWGNTCSHAAVRAVVATGGSGVAVYRPFLSLSLSLSLFLSLSLSLSRPHHYGHHARRSTLARICRHTAVWSPPLTSRWTFLRPISTTAVRTAESWCTPSGLKSAKQPARHMMRQSGDVERYFF